jgi:Secretion system C-terminal sorting domain
LSVLVSEFLNMRNCITICLLALLGLLYNPMRLGAQGLMINEISNGPAGSQEYIEFVVVGATLTPNCGPIDVRGWIFDDNNGDFSCGACAGTGIANGHQRFGNLPVWSAVPTGSIIVVYDPAVKNTRIPADDRDDTVVPDGVYILPSNDPSLEASATPCGGGNLPTGLGACSACTGNPAYTGVCYTAGLSNTNWGLRNSGDAAQVRRPNGTYFHGLGYGTAASLISGGPDGLMMPGDGSGRCYSFANPLNDDFRAVGNFVTGTVASNAETPGLGNSANNLLWLASLKVACPLAVAYQQELSGRPLGTTNLLQWATATEVNAELWEVLRSDDLNEGFHTIGTVAAMGNSSRTVPYRFTDTRPLRSTAWYQLRQHDKNGASTMTSIIEISNPEIVGASLEVWPNPSEGVFKLRGALQQNGSLQVLDALGRVVYQASVEATDGVFAQDLDLSSLPQGQYVLQLRGDQSLLSRRIMLLHTR